MKQTLFFLKHNILCETKSLHSWFASSFLGFVLLFLFSMSFEGFPPETQRPLGIAQLFLGAIFVLQNVHSRLFEHDQADKAQIYLLRHVEDSLSFYIAKVIFSVLLCTTVLIPYVVGLHLFAGSASVVTWLSVSVLFAVVVALSALGVLLSQLTQRSTQRQLVFPLLYFPLNIPVLVMGMEASLSSAQEISSWWVLLMVFAVVYVTLGALLFDELQGME